MNPINIEFFDKFAEALNLLTKASDDLTSKTYAGGELEISASLDDRFTALLGWDELYCLYGDILDSEIGDCMGLEWDDFIKFVTDYLEF